MVVFEDDLFELGQFSVFAFDEFFESLVVLLDCEEGLLELFDCQLKFVNDGSFLFNCFAVFLFQVVDHLLMLRYGQLYTGDLFVFIVLPDLSDIFF